MIITESILIYGGYIGGSMLGLAVRQFTLADAFVWLDAS
jgi:hypothetical protein